MDSEDKRLKRSEAARKAARARWDKTGPEERSKASRKAVQARWKKTSKRDRKALASKLGRARWEQTRKPAGKSRAVIVRMGRRNVSYPSVTAAAKAAKVSRPGFYYGWLSKGKAWYADEGPQAQ